MTTLGDVYRRAAEIVDTTINLEIYALCYSSYVASDYEKLNLIGDYDKYFDLGSSKTRHVRVLALLIMAAMADAGDL